MHQQTWIVHTHFNIEAKQERKKTSRQCVVDGKETHLHNGWPILTAHHPGCCKLTQVQKRLRWASTKEIPPAPLWSIFTEWVFAGKPHCSSAFPWVSTTPLAKRTMQSQRLLHVHLLLMWFPPAVLLCMASTSRSEGKGSKILPQDAAWRAQKSTASTKAPPAPMEVK